MENMDSDYQNTQEFPMLQKRENEPFSTKMEGFSKEYWETHERAEEESTNLLWELLGMRYD